MAGVNTESIKSVTLSSSSNRQYSDIAEQYGERFAAFFGCSVEKAKAILSNPRALQAMGYLRNNFSQHLITVSHVQIAEFLKGLNAEKVKLAKRALDEGISFNDLDTVYKYGESIFDKKSNKTILSDLKHTSSTISLFSENAQSSNKNAQRTLAVA